MADIEFLNRKNNILRKFSEVQNYSAVSTKLSDDSTKKYFLDLFSIYEEAFDAATDAFNKSLTQEIYGFETLISYINADYYSQIAFNIFKKYIDPALSFISILDSKNFDDNLFSLITKMNFIIEDKNREISYVLEYNFLENIKIQVNDLFGYTEPIKEDSKYGIEGTPLEFIDILNNLVKQIEDKDFINAVVSSELLTLTKNKMIDTIQSVINGSFQVILDLFYSWKYIEDTRKAADSFYNSDYIEIYSSIEEITKKIKNAVSINEVSDFITEEYKIEVSGCLSLIESLKSDITTELYTIVSLINDLQTENENYSTIFKYSEKYGSILKEAMKTYETILESDVFSVKRVEDIPIEVTLSDIFEESNSLGAFLGSEFIQPIPITSSQLSPYTFSGNATSEGWYDKYPKETGYHDSIFNNILLFFSNRFAYFNKRFNKSGESDAYKLMRDIALKNILDKDLYEMSAAPSELSSLSYRDLQNRKRELKSKSGLSVSPDYNFEKISTELTILFPKLELLSFIDVDEIKTGISIEQNKKIDFIIADAILSEKEYKTKLRRLKNILKGDFKSDSVKTLFFFRNIVNVSEKINNELITEEDYKFSSINTDNASENIRSYFSLYNDIYGGEGISKFIKGTRLEKFLKDEIDSIKANIVSREDFSIFKDELINEKAVSSSSVYLIILGNLTQLAYPEV